MMGTLTTRPKDPRCSSKSVRDIRCGEVDVVEGPFEGSDFGLYSCVQSSIVHMALVTWRETQLGYNDILVALAT